MAVLPPAYGKQKRRILARKRGFGIVTHDELVCFSSERFIVSSSLLSEACFADIFPLSSFFATIRTIVYPILARNTRLRIVE